MFFPEHTNPPQPTQPGTGHTSRRHEPDEPVDLDAEAAVTAMEADPDHHTNHLHQLDRSIRAKRANRGANPRPHPHAP